MISLMDALQSGDVSWDMRTTPCISDSCSVDTHWSLEIADPRRIVPDKIWDEIHATTPFFVTLNGTRWLPLSDVGVD